MDTDNGTRWGHASTKRPERWDGGHITREEAIADGLASYCGADFWICSGVAVDAESYLPDVEDLVNDMKQRAADECGEAAEEWFVADDEGREALAEMLKAWCKKHAAPPLFWEATGQPERILGTGA